CRSICIMWTDLLSSRPGLSCHHYTELNDNWHSDYNINGNSYCNGNYYSPKGWYRMFVGQTSAQIPETCVQDSRCSSYNRYEMTQPHPTQYNQTVTRSLCYSYGSSCCYYTSDTIKVKLCYGDYYVYKLQRLPGCNTAYCLRADNRERSVPPSFEPRHGLHKLELAL
uniref:UMOD/GP2/OIT3-like D8C domain-containing protein n=1 Tax=Oryzias latipes TaxID=8090 RepID=A0A3P9JEA4_ORYLA